MGSESQPAKVCIACKQDCSAKPRTKDAQGRYTCRECFDKLAKKAEAKQAEAAAPVSAADSPFSSSDDIPAGFFDQAEAGGDGSGGAKCPGCGRTLLAGATSCSVCGHGVLGAINPVRVIEKKAPGIAARAAVSAAKGTAGFAGWIIGGVVGGAVGAAIWAGVAFATGIELGWIAWGVGILTGMGVRIAAGNSAGVMSGLVAAVIAVAAVAGGRYAAIYAIVQDRIGSRASAAHLSDEELKVLLAIQVADEWQQNGKRVKWPNGVRPEEFKNKQSFPQDVWADMSKRWDAASSEWKAEFRSSTEANHQAQAAQLSNQIIDQGFINSIGAVDVIFILLAIGSAYTAGGVGGDD